MTKADKRYLQTLAQCGCDVQDIANWFLVTRAEVRAAVAWAITQHGGARPIGGMR